MYRMRIIWICLAAGMGLTLSSGAEPSPIPVAPVSGGIEWIYDYAKGRDLAGQSGKPVFVVFRCER